MRMMFGATLAHLADGAAVPAHTRGKTPTQPPPWLQRDKLLRGQRFARDHLLGVVYAQLLSLILMFAYPDVLRILIFTGKSHTRSAAFKRYFSTICRIISWFDEDLWSDTTARRHIKAVRAFHSDIQRKLKHVTAEKLAAESQLGDVAEVHTRLVEGDVLGRDLRTCPMMAGNFVTLNNGQDHCRPVNQFEMALTLFGFFGLIVLRPDKFGAALASDADLDAFAHLWSCIGFLLGIEDKYNICHGDLHTVRSNCQQIMDVWMKPSLGHLTREWEYVSRCIVEGVSRGLPQIPLEVSLLYLCSDVMNIPMPHLASTINWSERIKLWAMNFLMSWVMRIPIFRRLFNLLFRQLLKRVQTAIDMQL